MRLPKLIVVWLLVGSLAARADDLKEQARRDVNAALTEAAGAPAQPADPAAEAAAVPSSIGAIAGPDTGHGERSTRSNTATWITGVGGGAALIGGLVFGSLARSKLNAATAICGADH